MLLAEKVTWPSGGRRESTPTRKRLRKEKRRRRRKSNLNFHCIPKRRRKREKPEGKCATGQTQVFIGNSNPNSNSHLSEDLFLETMGDKDFARHWRLYRFTFSQPSYCFFFCADTFWESGMCNIFLRLLAFMLQVRCEDHIAFEFTKAKEEFGGGDWKYGIILCY